MAEAITASVVAQVGSESVVKTKVACSKQLIQLMPSAWKPEMDLPQFPGMGRQFRQGVALNREWSSFKIGGIISFNELVYMFSAAFGAAAITTPAGATLARQWQWVLPLAYTPRAQKTFSIEYGSTVKAESATGAFATGFSFKLARDNPSCEFDCLASNMTESITFTTTPTKIGPVAATGQMLAHYKDTTGGGIGGTKYAGKILDSTYTVGGLADVSWIEDRTLATWDAIIDLPEPSFEVMHMVEADATGIALVADARNHVTHYLRQEVKGELIETGSPNQYYLLQIDTPGQISAIDEYGDQNSLRALGVHWVPVEDSTLSPTITLVCKQTAL